MTHNHDPRLNMLRKRAERCVCKYCGEALEIRKIIFVDMPQAKTEIFCPNCNKIEFGVEKEIYQSAKYFVEEFEFNHYPQLDLTEYSQKMNIAKVCDIMSWNAMHLGILTNDGFNINVHFNEAAIGSSLLLDDELLSAHFNSPVSEVVDNDATTD